MTKDNNHGKLSQVCDHLFSLSSWQPQSLMIAPFTIKYCLRALVLMVTLYGMRFSVKFKALKFYQFQPKSFKLKLFPLTSNILLSSSRYAVVSQSKSYSLQVQTRTTFSTLNLFIQGQVKILPSSTQTFNHRKTLPTNSKTRIAVNNKHHTISSS